MKINNVLIRLYTKNQPGKNLYGHVKQSIENKTWKRSLPIIV